MQRAPIGLMVAAYSTEEGANHALHDLVDASKDGLLRIEDAAVLRMDAASRLHVDDIKDEGFGHGALLGGVTGAIVGLLTAPFGWASIGGVAIDELASRLRDSGFPDERLQSIAEGLQPGSSVLVAVVENDWIEEVGHLLRETDAEIVPATIPHEMAGRLDQAVRQTERPKRRGRAA